jgi:hypothetical protein
MNQRIWIYTLSKELTSEELADFNNRCEVFVNSWTAHDVKLDASYELYKNRLLIFKVNEASYNASGCSIDKQVRFIKDQEKYLNFELLNRMLIAYEENDQFYIVHLSNIKQLLTNGQISENTIVYNNTITSSLQLENEWKIALKKSWLAKHLVK